MGEPVEAAEPRHPVKPLGKGLCFISLGSGSSGNCAYLGTPTGGILIDAGIKEPPKSNRRRKKPEQDVLNRTKKQFLAEIRLCCGGRIAEEMFTGDVSTGAAQDIAQATKIAREMICRYGMSDRFGFQAFMEPSQFTGGELPPAFSEETSREIDAEVKRTIDAAYADARHIIERNRKKLEALANALIEKETMDGRDVEAMVRD
jgi:ATP-dependent Zn protease